MLVQYHFAGNDEEVPQALVAMTTNEVLKPNWFDMVQRHTCPVT